MKKNLIMAIVILLVSAAHAGASDVGFVWQQNPETEVTGYIVECDKVPHDDANQLVTKEFPNDADGQGIVHGTWLEFPVGKFSCVCIAKAGQLRSEPSDPVVIGIDGLGKPTGFGLEFYIFHAVTNPQH